MLVEDRRAGPAEMAAGRIDFRQWVGTLPRRNGGIAELPTVGERAKDVARRFGVSRARVRPLRSGVRQSWLEFQGKPVAATG